MGASLRDRAGGLKPRAVFHRLGLSALIPCAALLASCGVQYDRGVPIGKDGMADWSRVNKPADEEAARLYDERKLFGNCDDGYGTWGRAMIGGEEETSPNAEIDAQRYRSLGYISHCMTALQPIIAKALDDGKITWAEYDQISLEHNRQWNAEKDAWDKVRAGLAAKGFSPLIGAGYCCERQKT